MKNRQIWLRSRPNGIPQAADFDLREVELPTLADGEFRVHNAYLSADPAMRGWIADKSTYWPRIEVGDTMRAFAAGEVVVRRSGEAEPDGHHQHRADHPEQQHETATPVAEPAELREKPVVFDSRHHAEPPH